MGVVFVVIVTYLCVVPLLGPVAAAVAVTTRTGAVSGSPVAVPGRPPVTVYRGLQYASVGHLRFMPPTGPAGTWTGVRAATRFGPVCPQRRARAGPGHFDRYVVLQDEDCLYLNVHVPERSDTETGRLPVLVFVHGETFASGTGNAYDGSVLAAFARLIVITLNYRLGALGFLSTGDSNALGNYALLDIMAAAEWVKVNIGAFGGDRTSVTLLGHGHGAALVNLLLASPVTRGDPFYKRAILLSGTALNTWSVSADPIRYTTLLAEALNCSASLHDSAVLVRCLKTVPVERFLEEDAAAPKYLSSFAPVVTGHGLLPNAVRSLLDDPRSAFAAVDLLVGVAKDSGSVYLSEYERDAAPDAAKTARVMRTYVRNNYPLQRQKVLQVVTHAYTEWERPAHARSPRQNLVALLTDAQFAAPSVELLRRHDKMAAAASTYFLDFHYAPHRTATGDKPTGDMADSDLRFLFGFPIAKPDATSSSSSANTYTNLERMLSEALMTYVSNFVRSGNPNTPSGQRAPASSPTPNRFSGLEWTAYDGAGQHYLHMNMRPGVRAHYRAREVSLWLGLLPALQRPDGLPARHHLLDDALNASTFEATGTKPLADLPLPPVGFPVTTTPAACPRAVPTPPCAPPESAPPPPTGFPAVRGRKTVRSGGGRCGTTTGGGHGLKTSQGYTLSVVIAVGCSLLFLNVFFFFCTYYQRSQLGDEQKRALRGPGAGSDESSDDSAQRPPHLLSPLASLSPPASPGGGGAVTRSLGGDTADSVPDYYGCKRSGSVQQFPPLQRADHHASSTVV